MAMTVMLAFWACTVFQVHVLEYRHTDDRMVLYMHIYGNDVPAWVHEQVMMPS